MDENRASVARIAPSKNGLERAPGGFHLVLLTTAIERTRGCPAARFAGGPQLREALGAGRPAAPATLRPTCLAKAMIVIIGLTPSAVGKSEASAT